MDAKVTTVSDITIVHLSGVVDFDSQELFEDTVYRHLMKKKVVFDLTQLSFVGSNAITPLINTFSNIDKRSPYGLRLFGVSSEFKKILSASSMAAMTIFNDRSSAVASFQQDEKKEYLLQ